MFNITIYSDDFTQKTTQGDISTLNNGTYFYYNNQNITNWNKDLNSLKIGKRMFSLCYYLSKFTANLPNLVDGTGMFYGSGGLKSFKGNLNNLTCGSNMFFQTNLSSFNSELGLLNNGYQMFTDNHIGSFSIPLTNLLNGHYMFSGNLEMTSFTSDMPNLIYSLYMFKSCPIVQFRGTLSSLITGHMMFANCQLDPLSVLIILDNINNVTELKQKYTSGEIPFVEVNSENGTFSEPFGFTQSGNYIYTYSNPDTYSFEINAPYVGRISLGVGSTQSNITTYLQEIGYQSIEEIEADFLEKGWTVHWQFNGTATLSLDDTLPKIFTKLVEVTTIEQADFISQDGSKFYIIDWYHRTSGSDEDYDEFSCLSDAITSYGIIHK